MKFASLLLTFVLFVAGCATTKSSGSGVPTVADGRNMDLKATSTVGKLRAKITFSNTSTKEQSVGGLDPRFFRVETTDGKAMPFKGKSGAGEPIHIPASGTAEAAFDLQNSYPFWDRRTKYKIWYEGGGLKSNVVQVWF